jgi:hypothetical protein
MSDADMLGDAASRMGYGIGFTAGKRVKNGGLAALV